MEFTDCHKAVFLVSPIIQLKISNSYHVHDIHVIIKVLMM